MDKIDGPYYFFKLIQKLRHFVPEWVPLAGPELGWTNIVPVDYVVEAMDHIAHQPDLDGQAFHLTDTRGGMRSGEVLNTFARAAHAPQMAMRVDKKLTDALPKGVGSMLMQLPALKGVRRSILDDLHIPEEVVEFVGLTAQFDTRDTERALRGSGIELPELDSYAYRLWDYWERNLDPDLFKDRSLRGRGQRAHRADHRRLDGHRPGGGAEDRRGRRRAAAGGAHAREARGGARRDRRARRHRLRLPVRPVRPGRDRGDRRRDPRRARRRRHAGQQRRALDPPRRCRSATTASTTTSARCS